jgi:hypothetical protein
MSTPHLSAYVSAVIVVVTVTVAMGGFLFAVAR